MAHGDEMATVEGEIDLRREGDHVVVLAMNAQRLVLLVFFAGIFNH